MTTRRSGWLVKSIAWRVRGGVSTEEERRSEAISRLIGKSAVDEA